MSLPRFRLPRWLNILLVGALLWAPLWGHLHGIAHGFERGNRQALTAAAGQHEPHAHTAHTQDQHQHEGHSDSLGHEADSDLHAPTLVTPEENAADHGSEAPAAPAQATPEQEAQPPMTEPVAEPSADPAPSAPETGN